MDVNISWLSLQIHLRLLLVAYNLLQPDDISEGHRWIAGMEPFYDPGPWLAHQMVFPMGGLHCLDPCLHCASSTSVTLANFRMVVKYLRLWEELDLEVLPSFSNWTASYYANCGCQSFHVHLGPLLVVHTLLQPLNILRAEVKDHIHLSMAGWIWNSSNIRSDGFHIKWCSL